mmetsp:Transcript_41162/g.101260  ORF Transcript_41162/g.101260 Transcript_41162/m.101260 type:complete len:473 (-) Transcript_41162:71-1489(-)|eukprot:CAMPEP_0198315242 /NCGR_PEP_ID=MMETSP1450-20131203/5583_1 /TAXON_ID=753684 ORGANISM="Madagascaria erythrocladiodes, Strain CCMP3234" /NCGR_SAMPLE_ID=MMETSP1450 /ASSEMBLY_ACC=CAM_ASM_001115 /LENGTH=472 /DNA_ID=CAMNT_0044018349 /DNA_START=239 /DNA_END=1657 /DNA_ORIENTATION=+
MSTAVFFAAVVLAASASATKVIVPSRLLHRMQTTLIETGTFIQATDFEELEGLGDMGVFERNFLGAVAATCDTALGQGQRLRVSNAQATINVCNEVLGNLTLGNIPNDMESVNLLAIGEGGEAFFSSEVGQETELELFWLNPAEPFGIFEVNTPERGRPEQVQPASSDAELFTDDMTVSQIASVCQPNGPNVIDTRQAGEAIPDAILPDNFSNLRSVERVEEGSRTVILPYSNLPSITTVINLFYSPSDVVVEIASLMLVFVDLWFLQEIKPPKPVRASTLATVILVAATAIIVGAMNIYTISQTQRNIFKTWIGCGTWEMVQINVIALAGTTPGSDQGFMGRYVCQMITIQRSVAWYAYLLYVIPVMVILTVSTVTVYALVIRFKYGVDKTRSIRRASMASVGVHSKGALAGDVENDEDRELRDAESAESDQGRGGGIDAADDNIETEQQAEPQRRESKGIGGLFSGVLPL